MKKILFLGLLSGLFMFHACKDDDDPETAEPDYHAHIHAPTANAAYVIGDTLHVEVEFEDHNGGTIHHINVRVFNKTTGTDIFNEPANAHVHVSNPHTFEHGHVLTGIDVGTYTLEAKVWGHDDGVAEVVEIVDFTVN